MPTNLIDPRGSVSLGADPRQGLQITASRNTGQGVVAATPQTEAGYNGMMPQFLASMVEPYIQRKQQENFFKGLTDQAAAGAENSIIDDDGPVARIFGPNYYQQGAAAFQASEAVENQQAAWAADSDTLKRMNPGELSKKLAADSQALLTGNRWTDAIIQKGLTEKMVPFIDTVAKQRIAWQQSEAKNSWVRERVVAGSNLHAMIVEQSKLNGPNPSADTVAAKDAATLTFLKSYEKPPGMLDSAYEDGMQETMRSFLENGNFHAYQALKDAGVLNAMDMDASTKLEALADRKETSTLTAAAQGPEYRDRINKLNYRVTRATLGPDWQATADDPHPITGDEYQTEMLSINEDLKRQTGARRDLFDYEKITAGVDNIWDAMATSTKAEGAERRRVEEKAADKADKLAERQAEAEKIVSNGALAWSAGGITQAIASGATTREAVNAAAAADVQRGDMTNIIARFRETEINPEAAKWLVQPLQNSLGRGYTDGMQTAYKNWKTINQEQPGAALAYFGPDLHQRMQQIDTLLRAPNPNPEMAFNRVFGDKGNVPAVAFSQDDWKEGTKAVDAWVKDSQPSGFFAMFGGQKPLNASGEAALKRAITTNVAILRQNGDTAGVGVLTPQAYKAAVATGALAHYGEFAWEQAPGTPQLDKVVGIPPDVMTGVLSREIDTQLKAQGSKVGAAGTRYVFQRRVVGDTDQLSIIQHTEDGKSYAVVITPKQLKARVDAESRAKANAPRTQMEWVDSKDGALFRDGKRGFYRMSQRNAPPPKPPGPTAEQRLKSTATYQAFAN